jgi:hypothetical protein
VGDIGFLKAYARCGGARLKFQHSGGSGRRLTIPGQPVLHSETLPQNKRPPTPETGTWGRGRTRQIDERAAGTGPKQRWVVRCCCGLQETCKVISPLVKEQEGFLFGIAFVATQGKKSVSVCNSPCYKRAFL